MRTRILNETAICEQVLRMLSTGERAGIEFLVNQLHKMNDWLTLARESGALCGHH